jgi:hypothetical protein
MAPPTQPEDEKEESNIGLFVALGAVVAVLVIGLVVLKLRPPPPPPPPKVEAAPQPKPITETLHSSPGYYKATVEEDARRFGLEPVDLADLATPLKHAVELDAPRTIAVGQTFETAHLELRAEVVKEWSGAGGGQAFRFDHLVLSVANRSPGPIAYRIDTAIDKPERCRTKGAIAQNAIALNSKEKVRRTECLYHPGARITLTHIEAVDLPPIGYYYVSRLTPDQIGLSPRTSAGHVPPKGKPCQFVPWRDIQAGGAGWADVIDFYARHNCDEYTFFATYRFRDEALPLPAVEAKAKPPGGDAPGKGP